MNRNSAGSVFRYFTFTKVRYAGRFCRGKNH